MTTHDKLMQGFDDLDADINSLLARYRKVKRDRVALLDACKQIVSECESDIDMSPSLGAVEKCASAIAQAESEE